ncbi:kinase-like domain-containing protein, partial [Ganoderma leucocontextum]
MAAADSLPDFTGYFLDDRYELLKLLGSGSFGVVYKAIDHEVADDYDNIVAVKILRKAGRSAAHLASIKREVAFHSTVADNEGVVTLFDTFDDAKWCYLVLEFCGGGDLFDQIITKQTYLGNDELLRRAFLSLVDAVQGCHDAGISHRDLKPENVLTNKDGSQCHLADFGLATNEPLVREFGVGTGLYMSPECIGDLTARRSYDPYLSDIWSLGVILVNMVTAQNPWARATPKDANFCRFLMDPDFLYNAYPMSEGAHDIIQSLLELHPAQRMSLHTLREEILSLDTFFR